MRRFDGQKILLVAPVFFGYENEIIKKLEDSGATVFFVQENIDSTGFGQKIINKFSPKIQQIIRTSYFINSFKSLPLNEFDYVFCIRIDLFNDDILSYLRENCIKAKFILYFWDSVDNMRRAEANSKYFDRVSTFDLGDYERYQDVGWKFRPLFYIDKFRQIINRKDCDIDFVFIASLSPSRAKLYIELNEFCKKYSKKMITYFYMKPYVFLANIGKVHEYRQLDRKDIHGEGLSMSQICEYFSRANCVIDCSSPTQNGLTMRTIECFGANKKIITTNAQIRLYDFYNPLNHFVLEANNRDELYDFIVDNRYEIPERKTYYKYSIEGWIAELFCHL